jgi:uncharacterized protein involved in type VI secretion and phage assembly
MNLPLDPIASSAVALVEQPKLFQGCRIEMPGGKVLGDSALRLVQFHGQESVSEPFEYQLELHGDTTASGGAESLAFSQIIGRPITVGVCNLLFDDRSAAQEALSLALDGGGAGEFSLFNGIVASFAIEVPGVYRVTMRPAAWRMGLTNRYRIFGQQSVREVLQQLCREHRVEASFDGLEGSANIASTRVQDWLQAGETDLEFMRRLMTKAHVFYYFTHSAGRHVMVFDNQPVYPPALTGDAPLLYTDSSMDELGAHQWNTVSQYSYQQSLGISGVDGVFTQLSEAWDVTQPGDPLANFTSFRANSRPDTGDLPFTQYKIVQYGFSDNEVRDFAQSTESAMHATNVQLNGASRCSAFRVGHRFSMGPTPADYTTLEDDAHVRPELAGVEFVLTQVQHSSSLDGDYSNQFTATLADGLISMVGIQDTQQGMVLAHVTTPEGSEAIQDWPYYVPDDFNLGRHLLQDSQGVQRRLDAKGVYVRFSCDGPDAKPVWVKLAAHMQTIPEVGCSVWVSRANDESELPEVQNMVQADGSKVITDSGWTAHTQVGNSYSTSFGDSRSVRFGQPWSRADVSKAVSLVENAYATGKFRDASYSRGGNYGYSTSENAEKGVLNESWSFGSSYSYSWSLEQKSFSAAGSSHHQSVIGKSDPAQVQPEAPDADTLAAAQSSHSVVWGNTYSKSDSHGDTKSVAIYTGKVENDSTHNGDVLSNTTISGTSTNNSTHHGKVSSKSDIFADSENVSTITGTSTSRSTHNIVHNFTTVAAQSSSSAIGATNSNDVVGVSNSNSATGASNRNSLVGANIDLSLQGTGNAVSIIGMENRVTMTGMNNTLSVTGESNTISVTGATTTVEVAGAGVHVSAKSAQASIDLNGPVMQIPVIILVL